MKRLKHLELPQNKIEITQSHQSKKKLFKKVKFNSNYSKLKNIKTVQNNAGKKIKQLNNKDRSKLIN